MGKPRFSRPSTVQPFVEFLCDFVLKRAYKNLVRIYESGRYRLNITGTSHEHSNSVCLKCLKYGKNQKVQYH